MNLDILRIILESGLVVKSVLLILVGASIFSWAIIFKKLKQYKLYEQNNSEFLSIYNAAKKFKMVVNETNTMTFTPYREIFIEGYNELVKLRQNFSVENRELGMREHFKHYGMDIIVRAMNKGEISSNLKMQSFMSILASIGSISPFVGLLGTVWGIINSFSGLASGNATLDAVAPGIAEALVATAIGLAAAIPATWFYNYFVGRVEKINSEIQSFEQDFLNTVERMIITVNSSSKS